MRNKKSEITDNNIEILTNIKNLTFLYYNTYYALRTLIRNKEKPENKHVNNITISM